MNYYKKMFIVYFMILIFLSISSCKKNDNKSEFELFVDEYNKHHPETYTLEEGTYSIRTYETTFSKNKEYSIEEYNYTGTISFKEKEFYGYLSNFSYEYSKVDVKDNCIVNSVAKQAYCYNDSYYEVFTDKDNKTTTYGCNDIQSKNIKFWTHTSIDSLTRFFFSPGMLIDLLKTKTLIKSAIVEDLTVKMVFEVPKYENTKLEHTFTYYYDNQYNLLKVVRTSTYYNYDENNTQREYFYTSTLEKNNDYVSNEINLEYDLEKNFQTEDLYFMF